MVVKRRRSPIFQLTIIAILGGCILLINSNTQLGLILLGIFAVSLALVIEYNSGRIWRQYKRNYQPSRRKWFNTLNKPRDIYNYLNIYVLWPGVFILGIWAIYTGLHLQ
ncbi:MAG TPA: hypothetical protein VLE72_01850 [Candidatus Saccharimonadales bacterium]|nr:hypothetical protein [Candidatus Saccharimonadales bacterium]